eukprot:COSAG01_NODE_294_length_19294_cov_35.559312_21_plen_53_part_00
MKPSVAAVQHVLTAHLLLLNVNVAGPRSSASTATAGPQQDPASGPVAARGHT